MLIDRMRVGIFNHIIMTEKEKCRLGLLYNAVNDSELVAERVRCKSICHQYNITPYADVEAKERQIKQLFGQVGDVFAIEPSFWCDYGYNIQIGDNFFSNHNLVIIDCAQVSFGNNVLIGPNCGFYTAGHPTDVEARMEGLEFARPITIGNNVWIGGNVAVMPGVNIGHNSVIGAGSVVVNDIPDNVVAVGNPCRVIKKIK